MKRKNKKKFVYCSECRHVKIDYMERYICKHPDNKKTVHKFDRGHIEAKWEPKNKNKNCDCPLWQHIPSPEEKKAERKKMSGLLSFTNGNLFNGALSKADEK